MLSWSFWLNLWDNIISWFHFLYLILPSWLLCDGSLSAILWINCLNQSFLDSSAFLDINWRLIEDFQVSFPNIKNILIFECLWSNFSSGRIPIHTFLQYCCFHIVFVGWFFDCVSSLYIWFKNVFAHNWIVFVHFFTSMRI
jgi:hypothetical protein